MSHLVRFRFTMPCWNEGNKPVHLSWGLQTLPERYFLRGTAAAPRSSTSWTTPPLSFGEVFPSTAPCVPVREGWAKKKPHHVCVLWCRTQNHVIPDKQKLIPTAALPDVPKIVHILFSTHADRLTRFISLSPSSSLQFLFFSLWASSITTQRQCSFLSSGQSAMIISKVVINPWNFSTPGIVLPCGWQRSRQLHTLAALRSGQGQISSSCDSQSHNKVQKKTGDSFLFFQKRWSCFITWRVVLIKQI